MNWDDIRYLLAIGRSGTLSAAARQLKVDQTTVARRLKGAEGDLGVRLFDRIEGRHMPTAQGEMALQRGTRVELEVLALENAMTDRDASLSGTVRVTAIGDLITHYLAPRFCLFRRDYPEIFLELIGETGNLSLSRREADIAIRLARPAGGAVTARKIADMGFAVYGARETKKAGAANPLQDQDWVTYDDSLAHLPEAQWLARSLPGVHAVLRINRMRGLAEAVRHGVGVGLLPCYLAEPDPGFVRLSGPVPAVTREVWLLVHQELRNTARVRAVCDWLIALWHEDRTTFAGRIGTEGHHQRPLG